MGEQKGSDYHDTQLARVCEPLETSPWRSRFETVLSIMPPPAKAGPVADLGGGTGAFARRTGGGLLKDRVALFRGEQPAFDPTLKITFCEPCRHSAIRILTWAALELNQLDALAAGPLAQSRFGADRW